MRPTSVDNAATPVVLYRQPSIGADHLVMDSNVIVNRVVEGIGGNSDADMTLMWHAVPSAGGGLPVRAELSEAAINTLYGPLIRCAVGTAPTADGGLESIKFLAHGYIEADSLHLDASGRNRTFRRGLKLRSILHRTASHRDSQIQGRYMITAAARDAHDMTLETPIDDVAWAGLAKHVAALPCIFNAEGKPNRMRRPVMVDSAAAWTQGPIHLFTYEGDPNAEYWTFLQALRYLVMVYLPYGLAAQVGPGDLFTETLAGPSGSPWWALPELSSLGLGFPQQPGWRNMMVRNCHSLAVEGMSILEAMLLISAQSGMRFSDRHTNESAGGEIRVLSELDFWCPDDRAEQALALERDGSHYDASGALRPIDDILDANNVANATLQRDLGNTLSRVEVVGDRKWVTLVAELVPMWKPDSLWDNVDSGTAEGYRSAAYSDDFSSLPDSDFYKRYHAKGEDHEEGQYALVGRYWGLDPAGELDAAEYNRAAGPWTAYTPWTLTADLGGAIPTQVRRRRAMRAVPSPDPTGRQIGVLLDISFDAGATWNRLDTQFAVETNLMRVYLRAPEILAVGREILERVEESSIDNVYHAYLTHQLRLRTTFQTDMDECVLGASNSVVSPLTPHAVTRIVTRPKDLQYWQTDTGAGLDVMAIAGVRNDDTRANALAAATLTERETAKWSGVPAIPWIETERYGLGTPIEGIRRRAGGPVEISFGGSAGLRLFPHVIQRVYMVAEQTTTLTLEDYAMRKGLMP